MTIICQNHDADKTSLCKKNVKVSANMAGGSLILKPAQEDEQIKASCCHRPVHHKQFSRLQELL